MKVLNGAELASYIKAQQAKTVRSLTQTTGVRPRLAILQTKDDPVINTYVRLKKSYGADIGIDVDVHFAEQPKLPDLIKKVNKDNSVQGVIIQLPLTDTTQTEELVNLVAPQKDVDALGAKAAFEPATPMAILWLISGYNVDLNGKKIVLIGRGKLVGAPLEKIFKQSGHNVDVVDRKTKNVSDITLGADVIITATGTPGILKADMVKPGAVVIDAGVASESGKKVGDLAEDVYQRDDLTITPKKGGVGPLTVCALFENVIRATQQATK